MAYGKWKDNMLGGYPQAGASGQVGNTAYRQVSPLQDAAQAALYQRILETLDRIGRGPRLEQILNKGAESKLMQSVLKPSLRNLLPAEELARNAMTDQFRASGGLRSGAYANAVGRNELNILQNRDTLISEVMRSMLPTIVSGMNQQTQNAYLPIQSMLSLLQASRPQTVTGSTAGQSLGSGTGTYGGTSTFDRWKMEQLQRELLQSQGSQGYDPYYNLLGGGGIYIGPEAPASLANPYSPYPWEPSIPYAPNVPTDYSGVITPTEFVDPIFSAAMDPYYEEGY